MVQEAMSRGAYGQDPSGAGQDRKGPPAGEGNQKACLLFKKNAFALRVRLSQET
jgi:hypothetical protein